LAKFGQTWTSRLAVNCWSQTEKVAGHLEHILRYVKRNLFEYLFRMDHLLHSWFELLKLTALMIISVLLKYLLGYLLTGSKNFQWKKSPQ